MIAHLGSLLRRTGRIAADRPRATLWTTLALTCALLAVAIAGVAATNVDRWAAERPGSRASMVVYLGEGVAEPRARELVSELRALPGVEAAVLVPASESGRRLVKSLGSDEALLDGIDIAALPASVEVTLAPGVGDVVAMSSTVRALRGSPSVADVVVDNADDDRISGALASVRTLAWGAAALFGALALITAIAAIRVRFDSASGGRGYGGRGRNELAVAALLGAGPGFLVIPTALAGAAQGLAAAALAGLTLVVGLELYGESITGSLATTLGSVELATPELAMFALLLGAGALLGVVGGGLAGASRGAR